MKKSETAEHAASSKTAKKEDLELAREIHALVRLVEGQLVATHPWAALPPGSVPMPGAFPHAWSVPGVWPCTP